MRKVILSLAVSLDGYIEGPNAEYDWCFTDQDYGLSDFFKRIDSVFMGRRSYELTLSMGNSAMAGVPKFTNYIFSRTLTQVRTGEVLIRENIREEVEKIKNEEGKDIWLFGGADLTTTLLNLNLVDEIQMAVHPVILGAGKPLFQGITNRLHLKLVDCKEYSSGLVALTYHLE